MSLQDTILQVVTQTHEAGREAANLSMTLKEKILVEMAREAEGQQAVSSGREQ